MLGYGVFANGGRVGELFYFKIRPFRQCFHLFFKLMMDPSTSGCSRQKRVTLDDALRSFYDSDSDDCGDSNASYPVDDLTSSSSDSHTSADGSDGGRGDAPPAKRPNVPQRPPGNARKAAAMDYLWTGWSKNFTAVDTFLQNNVGPKNIPPHIDADSEAIDFLSLYLDDSFWDLLCTQTNLRAEQVKAVKPKTYSVKNYKPVDAEEMKAFWGLRLQMEQSVVKPRYESYWYGVGKNFVSYTPGFRDIMDRDRFLSLWTNLHLVDETDSQTDKTDKIYKVRPMLNMILPKFREYFTPRQYLSLDEGGQGQENKPLRASGLKGLILWHSTRKEHDYVYSFRLKTFS